MTFYKKYYIPNINEYQNTSLDREVTLKHSSQISTKYYAERMENNTITRIFAQNKDDVIFEYKEYAGMFLIFAFPL